GQVREIQVPVEIGAESAIFGIGITDPADAVTLSLRSPSGAIFTASSVGAGIEFSSEPNSKAFQILAPEAGTWTIIVSAGTIVNGNLEAFSSAEHDGVHFGVSVTKETLAFPEMVEVQAAPTFGGERVIGATVAGNVIRPDGSRVAITLFDDGLATHGDKIAGDGIYTALFSQYNMSGTYTFELTVLCSGGVTSAGEVLFDFAPQNTKSVPAFTRTASATTVVTGVPVGADLSITKIASPNPVVTGSNVTYTLTVINNGPGAAANVVVTDNLPASTTFVSCSSTGGGVCSGSGNNRSITFTSLAAGASATINLGAKVDCSVTDGTAIGNMATVGSSTPDPDISNNSKTATITASNPPPTITGTSADPSVLWPPNHKMVNVTVNYTVTDNCPPPANACTLSVTSNEPVDGTGDGDTAPDWEIIDAHHVRLRAERAGNGPGRIYTIAITCTDNVGSSSSKTVTVTVPHNQ